MSLKMMMNRRNKVVSRLPKFAYASLMMLNGLLAQPASGQTSVSLPACFISGAGGTVANITMSVGQLCIDDGKIKKLFKECKGSEATSSFDFSRCIKNANKTEIAAQFSVQAGTINACPSSGSGGCATVDVGASASAASGGSGTNAGASTSAGTNTGASVSAGNSASGRPSGGDVVGIPPGPGGAGGGRMNIDGSGGGSSRGSSSRASAPRSTDARTNAQTDVDILARHCGDTGDLNGYDVTRQGDLDSITDSLKNYASNCAGADCVSLSALKAAMTTALNSCHSACVHIALDKDNACYWKNITGAGKFQNENEFCQVLTATEPDTRVSDFLAAYPGSQNDCKTLSARNTDAGAVCRSMIGDRNCAQVMRTDGFACDAFKPAADAYYAAQSNYDQLLADQKVLNGPSDSRKCKISSASDAARAYDSRDTVSIKCLIDMEASCALAMDSAQTRFESVSASQRAWCPTCNQNQGQQSSTCQYGGTCNGGVSKTAQILNGIANIGGQIVTPLGLGLMNMSMNNRSLAACTSIATQQIDLYKNVGLTGPVNSCGTGGFGMSGYSGINGASGVGGYNPYGTSGSSTGYNPYGSSLGLSLGLGTSGTGYNPYSSMGMSGSSYNPYASLGMGMGMNMGMNLGSSGYSPYGSSQYGLSSGLYSNNMYQSQSNMSSVMQQMMMQNQLMGMSGSGYQSNPYMSGMGMSGYSSYNPYSQYSGYGSGNYGISAGISLGSGSYNPYAYSGSANYGSTCGYYTTGVPCSGY